MNRGTKYWESIADYLAGKEMTDEIEAYLNAIEEEQETDADNIIMAYLNILLENGTQKEDYFKDDLVNEAIRCYQKYGKEE